MIGPDRGTGATAPPLNQLIGNSVRGGWEFAANILAAMTNPDSGIQQISPTPSTAWQESNRGNDRRDDSDGDDAPADTPVRSPPPPPAPGTGKIVDRIV
jgi:hypothetical protein